MYCMLGTRRRETPSIALARLRLRQHACRLRLAQGSVFLPRVPRGGENLTHLATIQVVKFSSEAPASDRVLPGAWGARRLRQECHQGVARSGQVFPRGLLDVLLGQQVRPLAAPGDQERV